MRIRALTIKKLLGVKCMTQTELARLAGISRQNLSTILTRGTCSIGSAIKIANTLCVDIEEICEEG